MKRSIKCFGLLSALFTIFGLSLNVYSDTSAIKYTPSSLPYVIPTYADGSSSFYLSQPLSVTARDLDFGNPPAPWFFTAHKDQNGNCVYGSGGSNSSDYYNVQYVGPISIELGGGPIFINKDDNNSLSQCLYGGDSLLDIKFGSNGIPSFISSSIPLVGDPFTYNFRSFLPYNSDYYGFGILKDGSYGFTDAEIFGRNIPRPTDFILPLNVNYNQIKERQGSQYDFHVSYNFKVQFYGDWPQSPVNSDINIRIYLSYYYEDGNGDLQEGYDVNTCSHSENGKFMLVDCSNTFINSPYKNYVGAYISFQSVSGGYLWDVSNYTSDKPDSFDSWSIRDLTITTFYDDTPATEEQNNALRIGWGGVSQDTAPGTPGSYDSDDYFDSIINLFNFSFVNPFSGLFGLFTDSSRCVDIPIIAGMLGSDETQYCPWFDNTVRNILTPVLGIAANMLLFGFAVRWLGSSSGNNFEDTNIKESK